MIYYFDHDDRIKVHAQNHLEAYRKALHQLVDIGRGDLTLKQVTRGLRPCCEDPETSDPIRRTYPRGEVLDSHCIQCGTLVNRHFTK